MKIVVLSDTHIPGQADDLPDKVYSDLNNADLILHAGDFTSLSFLKKLQKLAPVKAVCGNMDEAALREELTERLVFTISKFTPAPLQKTTPANPHTKDFGVGAKVRGFTIGLMHGRGNPAYLLELLHKEFSIEKPDVIIFGHSHNALNLRKNGTLFFNPGSPTDKVFATANSYGIIMIDDDIKAEIVKL